MVADSIDLKHAPLNDFERTVARRAKEWGLEQVRKRLEPANGEKGLSLEGMSCLLYPPVEAFPNPNPADFALQGTFIYVLDYAATHPRLQIVLRCPNCSHKLSCDGWSRTATARPCQDIDRTHHILQRLYTCLECKKAKTAKRNSNEFDPNVAAGNKQDQGREKENQVSFVASSQAIMRQLPTSALPPIVITAGAAATKTLQIMVHRNVINGSTFQNESDALTELHRARHYEQMKAYYQYMADTTNTEQKSTSSFGSDTSLLKDPFPNPKAGEFCAGVGSQYLIRLYLSVFRNRQEHLARCLASTDSKVLGADHSFKTKAKHATDASDRKAHGSVFDMSNGYGQFVCLLFTSCKCIQEIEQALKELNAVWKETKTTLPEFMWVNSPMMRVFPSLQKVLEDATNGMHRYARTLSDGLPGVKAFMADLSKAFFSVFSTDEQELADALQKEGLWGAVDSKYTKAQAMIRNMYRCSIPPPEKLCERMQQAVEKHTNVLHPITNASLFTQTMWDVHESMLQLIDKGKLSDPLPEEVYLSLYSASSNKEVRKLEGFHNHLAKVLVGNKPTAELAGALVADFIHCWNIDRAADNISDTENYGCYDTLLLEEINNTCQRLKVGLPFPKLKQNAAPILAKLPPILKMDISEERVSAMKPPGGEHALGRALAEFDDACVGMKEFIKDRSCNEKLHLSTHNVDPGKIQAVLTGMSFAPATAEQNVHADQKAGTAATDILLDRGAQESKTVHPPSIKLRSGKSSSSSIAKHKQSNLTKDPTGILPFPETIQHGAVVVDYAHCVSSQEEAMMIETFGGDLINPQINARIMQPGVAAGYKRGSFLTKHQGPRDYARFTFKKAKHAKESMQQAMQDPEQNIPMFKTSTAAEYSTAVYAAEKSAIDTLDALPMLSMNAGEVTEHDAAPFDFMKPFQDLHSMSPGSFVDPLESFLPEIPDLSWHEVEKLFPLSKSDECIKATTAERKKFQGRGAPNKPRSCRKCKKPLRNKGRDSFACSCYSQEKKEKMAADQEQASGSAEK